MLNGFIAAETLLIYDYVCHVKSILFSRKSVNPMKNAVATELGKIKCHDDRKYSIPYTSIMETISKVYLYVRIEYLLNILC